MAVKTLLENHKIEEVIDKIIERFHHPLPDFIDNINKKGKNFFYKADIEGLDNLKNLFYDFTSVILTHIIDEEENWFPLMIDKINDPKIGIDTKILYKIAGEHNDFDIILDKLEEHFKRIDLDENNNLYNSYNDLLKDFSYLQKETKKHLEVEVQLTKEFTEIMKKNGIEIVF